MELNFFFPFFALILGLCLGSFYNVCIHRYLTVQSIVLPASHCPLCGRAIAWRDNIPLFSYFLLKGRCRSCGQPISPMYPLVEAVSGILAVLLAFKFGPSLAWTVYMFFTGLLIIAAFIDFKIYILPDQITLPGGILALAAAFILPVYWVDAFLGALLGAGFFLLLQKSYKKIKKIEGLGTGDVKLMVMLGALVGLQGLPILIFSAALLGLLASLFYMKKSTGSSMHTPIPFGPFLALGAMIYILGGDIIWMWYLSSPAG